MYTKSLTILVVVCMAIWPFSNSGSAQDGDGRSVRDLSERIERLERKINRLEAKIDRLENRAQNATVFTDGAPLTEGQRVGGKKPCPGEWRRIGGGWNCYNPNAK